MTPCSYDACNSQAIWETFAALDLWNFANPADMQNRSEIDSQVYYRVERLALRMFIPTW